MFARMFAVAALLASAGVALASDASFDRQPQASASKEVTAKSDAPRTPATGCSCQHGRS